MKIDKYRCDRCHKEFERDPEKMNLKVGVDFSGAQSYFKAASRLNGTDICHTCALELLKWWDMRESNHECWLPPQLIKKVVVE